MAPLKPRSLEERIQSFGGPVKMLRSSMSGSWSFPLPAQTSTWPEEQRAWAQSVVLMDMGQHMPSHVFKGPDVLKLFSRCAVNSFANFRRNSAKQLVMCRDDGLVIGDSVVVALEDDEFEVMGIPVNANWLQYQAQAGKYSVQVTYDPPTGMNPGERRFYRYQVQGPNTIALLEKAIGGPLPEIKFFHVGELQIAGLKTRAISHTMSRRQGFELFGPRAEGPQILAALREAGRQFGLRENGAISIPTGIEGGWLGLQMPAIYSDERMKPFREWVSEYGFEGFASLAGSFVSDKIEDYYVSPWDIGFGRLVKFDHDFIGRAALERLAAEPPRRQKVFFRWDDRDVARVLTSALFGGDGERPKMLVVPYSTYSTFPYDRVVVGDQTVGISMISAYTVNVGSFFSLGTIETGHAVDGQRVEIIWGDGDTSLRPIKGEPHVLTRIAATVHTQAIV